MCGIFIIGDDMENKFINAKANSRGIYLSFEQIELLSIINVSTIDELITFITNCKQFNIDLNKMNALLLTISNLDLEEAKRVVFKAYQDTLMCFEICVTNKNALLQRKLEKVNLNPKDIDTFLMYQSNKLPLYIARESAKNIIDSYYPNKDEITKNLHEYTLWETDFVKSISYEEAIQLNAELNNFDTILVTSGKIEHVFNPLTYNPSNKFDFYKIQRELDFCYKKGKHARYHSLLTKDDESRVFEGRKKHEVIKILTAYVKASIDFINNYNKTHQINGKGVIKDVDLFNEILSFKPDANNEYENIWQIKGISLNELLSIFEYAKINKSEGVSYLYNEPFLEQEQRRSAVLDLLSKINTLSPDLIDTLGSQMHIGLNISDGELYKLFIAFKSLENSHINVQITEFDASITNSEALKVKNGQIEPNDILIQKRELIEKIETIINNLDSKLEGITYWSTMSKMDHNLERSMKKFLLADKYAIYSLDEFYGTMYGGIFDFGEMLDTSIRQKMVYEEQNTIKKRINNIS